MKKSLALIMFLLLSTSAFSAAASSTLNPSIVPAPLIQAMQEVHAQAEQASLKNLFMYKYVYFHSGFCENMDCSSQAVESSIQLFKKLMGNEFSTLNKQYDFYVKEIQHDRANSKTGDVDSLLMGRSADAIVERNTFFTCVDYAKAIAKKALRNGMDPTEIQFFWLMDKAAYLKMCPSQEGQKALAPRPLVHTIIAYRLSGMWYAMNTENPNPEIIPLGADLPQKRLELQFVFALPALVGGKVLTYAGHYEFSDFLNGFPGQWIANITASGTPSVDTKDFVCR